MAAKDRQETGKNFAARYLVKPGKPFKLAACDPRDTGPITDKEKTKAETLKNAEAIDALQDRLFAEGERALLVVLQGIDCSGKDGTVRAVFNHCGPIGVRVAPFKAPNPDELAQDYLWRVHKACPPKGYIGIFNRSHYEDVLVVRVHELVPRDVWEARYDEINAFEKELVDSGTTLVKCALFVSLDEQKRRLAERLDRPDKYWKYNPGDLDERKLWPAYQEAYQAVLDRTSTNYAPWYVLPCDKKWYARLAVTELLIEALKDMKMSWPPADFDVEAEKKKLANL